jgi:hypothetical protein
MAESTQREGITSLAKEAFDDPAVSDFRKQRRSYGPIAEGITWDNSQEVTAKLMYDLSAGTMSLEEYQSHLAGVNMTYKRQGLILQGQGLILQEKDLNLHAKLRQQVAIRLEEKRALIEREGRAAGEKAEEN